MISILLVDDDHVLLEFARIFFEEQREFRLEFASSAKEALYRMQETEFDVIVADYLMPEMNGIEFLQQVHRERDQIPFIIFSDRGREEFAIEALNAGADFYLQKGGDLKVQFTELAHIIRSVVRQHRAEEELGKSEERYRRICEGLTDYLYTVCVRDGLAVTTTHSAASLVLTGYTPEEFAADPYLWIRMVSDEDRDRVIRHFNGILTGKQVPPVEHRIVRKDGQVRWVRDSPILQFDPTGRLISYDGVIKDITEAKRADEALSRLTKFQESVITNARVWLSVLDLKGTILMWNTAAEEISGYTAEEVIGRKEIWKKIYPDINYRRQVTDTITRIIRDKNYLENFETTILSKQGAKKVISWNTKGVPDTDGNVSDYIAIGVDVTDRSQAEDELRATERIMEDIINFLPDATFAINADGVVIAWNRAIEEMTGVHAEDMLGRGDYEYALPFYNERCPILIDIAKMQDPTVSKNYTSLRRDGDALTAETSLTHLGGKDLYLWGKSVLFKDGHGEVVGAIESIRDITDRKTAEELLKESRETYRELVESINDVIFEIDSDRKISYISPVVHKVLEYKPDEIIGKNLLEFVYPDDQDQLKVRFSQLSEVIEHPLDFRVLTKKGEVRWVRTQTKSIMNGMEFFGARGTLIDITDRKRAEQALREANKKLNLLSSITRHDINNQLMILMGYLTILKKSSMNIGSIEGHEARDVSYQSQPDPTISNYFGKVATAAQRISDMIRFTKEYEEIGVNAPAWQDCRTLVETAAKQALLGEITLRDDLPAETEVFADPLIVKVFYNLMDNAVRYGDKITTIRFYMQGAGESQVIVCEDDGEGVAAEEKEKIFERGFGKNTGLGLAISREILDITGITIRETGEPGHGARFEMTVPKGAWKTDRKGL